jgi:hypothetical protein
MKTVTTALATMNYDHHAGLGHFAQLCSRSETPL